MTSSHALAELKNEYDSLAESEQFGIVVSDVFALTSMVCCCADVESEAHGAAPDVSGFIVAQMSSLKRLVPRLTSMVFKMRFAESVADIKPDVVASTAALEEVKQSGKLAKILELVLLMGNYMNAGSHNAQSVGFEIAFLTKVSRACLTSCDARTRAHTRHSLSASRSRFL